MLQFFLQGIKYGIYCRYYQFRVPRRHERPGHHCEKNSTGPPTLTEAWRKPLLFCFFLRQNIAYNVKTNIKLGLHKSLVLPIVTGNFFAKLLKGTMNALNRLQKKAVKSILGKQTSYANSLRLLNILSLPMFAQIHDLLFSSLTKGNLANILNIHTKTTCSARKPMNYQIDIPRTEISRREFFRNCQILIKATTCFEFGNGTGLKDRLFCETWMHLHCQLDESNSCTWL